MIALIAEGMHKDGISDLHTAGIRTVAPTDSFRREDVDIIIVRSVFMINAQTADAFPRLRIVAKLGTGLDNIDQALCTSRDIAVIHAPGMNAVSTAEFAVAQILNIIKNTLVIHDRVLQKDFRRNLYYGRELSTLTAGVIGFGQVGTRIVERLQPFVRAMYIRDKKTQGDKISGTLHFVADQNVLLTASDIVVLAVPLQNNTKMVNRDFCSRLKDDCLLVNIARGGLIDNDALVAFLRAHSKARYYCDVIDPEPDYSLAPDLQQYAHPLFNLPNVLYTPHIANLTDECQRNIAVMIVQKIIQTVHPLH